MRKPNGTTFTGGKNLTVREEAHRRRLYPGQDPRWIRKKPKKFIDTSGVMRGD